MTPDYWESIRKNERLRMRRKRLRRRLQSTGVEALPDGWVVAPTRIGHMLVNGQASCGATWIDDGQPPEAPVSLCRRCGQRDKGEDWSSFA